MFTKTKDSAPEAIPGALAATPTLNQPPRRAAGGVKAAPSIISADLVVTGTLTSSGDMQVDGRVEGDVHSAGLTIGEKAIVQGEVFAEEVTVRGRVEGSIRARKILLCSTCHVEGNILHEAFSVEAGAYFEGNCRHSDNPLGEGAHKTPDYDRRPAGAPANGGGPIPPKPYETAQARPAVTAKPV